MAVPQVFAGRYRVQGRIGRGGMGALYLARDTRVAGRLVVVKVIGYEHVSRELLARFRIEMTALAGANHAHVVAIYDAELDSDRPFIVMEYVRGETLQELIARQAPLPLARRIRYLSELCSGLSCIHGRKIVHRDIKPANLIIDEHERLKILDFGVARVDDGHTLLTSHQPGTLGYMSPEQIEQGQVDARSDLFSAGAVGYALLSGREAFPGKTTGQILRKMLMERPTPLSSLVPDLDAAVVNVIDRALMRDPADRFQSAQEMRQALERVRERVGYDDVVSGDAESSPAGLPRTEMAGEVRAWGTGATRNAYQRALDSRIAGNDDFACRSAIEAIAEDPDHRSEAWNLLASMGQVDRLPPDLPPETYLAETVIVARPNLPPPPVPPSYRWATRLKAAVLVAAALVFVGIVVAAAGIAPLYWNRTEQATPLPPTTTSIPAEPKIGTLAVLVRDARQRIATDADVRLEPTDPEARRALPELTGKPDEFGVYTFADLPFGGYLLVVRGPGRAAGQEQRVTLQVASPRATLAVDLEDAPAPAENKPLKAARDPATPVPPSRTGTLTVRGETYGDCLVRLLTPSRRGVFQGEPLPLTERSVPVGSYRLELRCDSGVTPEPVDVMVSEGRDTLITLAPSVYVQLQAAYPFAVRLAKGDRPPAVSHAFDLRADAEVTIEAPHYFLRQSFAAGSRTYPFVLPSLVSVSVRSGGRDCTLDIDGRSQIAGQLIRTPFNSDMAPGLHTFIARCGDEAPVEKRVVVSEANRIIAIEGT
jgi:hypothetical protein